MLRSVFRNPNHRWLRGWATLSEPTRNTKQCEDHQAEHPLPISLKKTLEVRGYVGYDGYIRNFNRLWIGCHNNFWETLSLGASILFGIKYGLLYTKLKNVLDKKPKKHSFKDYFSIYSFGNAKHVILGNASFENLRLESFDSDILRYSILPVSEEINSENFGIIKTDSELLESICEDTKAIKEFSVDENISSQSLEESLYLKAPGLIIKDEKDNSLNHRYVSSEPIEGRSLNAPELIIEDDGPGQEPIVDVDNDSLLRSSSNSLLWKNSYTLLPLFDLKSLKYITQIMEKRHNCIRYRCFSQDSLLNSHQFNSTEALCSRIPGIFNQIKDLSLMKPQKVEGHCLPQRRSDSLLKEVNDLIQFLIELINNMVVEERCDIAATLAKRGDYASAIKIWSDIIVEHPLHGKSLYNLATCFENGLGLNKDINKAKELYKRAADLNHPRSCYRLARIYLREWRHGCKESLELSQLYSSKAFKLGFKRAGDFLSGPGSHKRNAHTRKRTSLQKSSMKSGNRCKQEARTNKFLEELQTNQELLIDRTKSIGECIRRCADPKNIWRYSLGNDSPGELPKANLSRNEIPESSSNGQ